MQKQQQHINHLLRRWISGEITDREERELEAAAEQDEVLRDAWSGYRSHAGADHEASLAKLRGRLARKHKPVRRILQPWMRIAAAVALLLVAGWAVFQIQQVGEEALATNQAEAPAELTEESATLNETEDSFQAETRVEAPTVEESPAMAKESVETGSSASSPSASRRDAGPITSAKKSAGSGEENTIGTPESAIGSLVSPSSASADLTVDDQAEKSIVLESAPVTKDEEIVTTAPPQPTPVTPDVYRTQSQAPPPVRLEDRAAISNSGVRVPNAGYRIISGYVTDEQGNPLIGASILEQGSANGTVADIDGYYELTVSNESETLWVNYTGFETTTVTISEEAEISVVLNENRQALDEVVVTDLSTGYDRQYTEEEEVIGNARPEGGFSDLRKYIKDNVAENGGRANVKIRFYVQADGRPANTSIVSSTNPSLNTEAIRLIEEGPNWLITSGEAPVEIVYTIKFR